MPSVPRLPRETPAGTWRLYFFTFPADTELSTPKALGYSRKKVGAVAAVVFAAAEATTLESSGRSRRGTGRCGRVFRRVLFRHGPLARRASLWFRTDSPCGVYCCARKQSCSLKCSFRMTASRGNLNIRYNRKPHPPSGGWALCLLLHLRFN